MLFFLPYYILFFFYFTICYFNILIYSAFILFFLRLIFLIFYLIFQFIFLVQFFFLLLCYFYFVPSRFLGNTMYLNVIFLWECWATIHDVKNSSNGCNLRLFFVRRSFPSWINRVCRIGRFSWDLARTFLKDQETEGYQGFFISWIFLLWWLQMQESWQII